MNSLRIREARFWGWVRILVITNLSVLNRGGTTKNLMLHSTQNRSWFVCPIVSLPINLKKKLKILKWVKEVPFVEIIMREATVLIINNKRIVELVSIKLGSRTTETLHLMRELELASVLSKHSFCLRIRTRNKLLNLESFHQLIKKWWIRLILRWWTIWDLQLLWFIRKRFRSCLKENRILIILKAHLGDSSWFKWK